LVDEGRLRKEEEDGEPAADDVGALDALKVLGEQFSDPSFKSSTRVLILISLALNKKLGFVDLLSLSGMGKGSLSNHLQKLETAGYIRSKSVMTFGGSRVVYEITQKGLDAYGNLLKTLGKLERNSVI
jgi:DNA-binding MarR family transcriptional regulator